MRNPLILISFIATLVAAPAVAQEPSRLTSLVTGNDSRGWEAVGRLDIGHTGFCTAAMIAPDLVLTAAHCLYDADTSRMVDASQMEFLAGWRNGRATAYRKIRRAIPHPDYVFEGPRGTESVDRDIALLELESPIRKTGVVPFDTATRPRKGAAVGVVSYAHNRAERPSIQETCHVLARPSDSLVLSCSVDFGSSGSPVFVIEDGVPRIVSVVSAKAHVQGRPVSLGSGLEAPLAELRTIMARGGAPGPAAAAPQVRRLTTDGPRQSGGAKFLRP